MERLHQQANRQFQYLIKYSNSRAQGLINVGRSSEVHQAGKGGNDVLSREKKHHLCVFNCPAMLYVISTTHKKTGIFLPYFFNPSASLVVLDFKYPFWALERNRAMGKIQWLATSLDNLPDSLQFFYPFRNTRDGAEAVNSSHLCLYKLTIFHLHTYKLWKGRRF